MYCIAGSVSRHHHHQHHFCVVVFSLSFLPMLPKDLLTFFSFSFVFYIHWYCSAVCFSFSSYMFVFISKFFLFFFFFSFLPFRSYAHSKWMHVFSMPHIEHLAVFMFALSCVHSEFILQWKCFSICLSFSSVAGCV